MSLELNSIIMNKSTLNQSIIRHFSVKNTAKISGLSVHMVNYLRRHGIVCPSVSNAGKRGVALKYSYTDILLLKVIASLLLQGISPLKLRKILASLQKRGHKTDELVSKKYVATDGHNIFFIGDNFLELLDSGQMAFAFVLELNSIRSEIESRILAA